MKILLILKEIFSYLYKYYIIGVIKINGETQTYGKENYKL